MSPEGTEPQVEDRVDHELLVAADVLDEVAMLGRRLVERLRLDPAMQVAEISEAVDYIVGVAREADRLILF